MPKPLSQAERDQIAELIRQGHPRNDIARRTGRGQGTITRIANDIGHAFDRAEMKTATEARQVDAAARRVELKARLVEEAHRALDDLHRPARVFNFGGRDNTFEERELEEPPFADKQRLMTIAGIAIDKVSVLERLDHQAEDLAAVDAWLRSIIGGTS